MINTLHVGNIGETLTDSDLLGLFAPAGNVTSAHVMMDAATGKSRGFGHVQMASPEESNNAIRLIDGLMAGGRKVTVRVLPPRNTGWEGASDQGGSNRSHGFGPGNGGSRF